VREYNDLYSRYMLKVMLRCYAKIGKRLPPNASALSPFDDTIYKTRKAVR